MVLHNAAVEYNVAAFSELSFAVCWQGRLSRIVHYIMGVRFSVVSVKRGSTVWWQSNEGISMQVWEMLRKERAYL